MKWSCHFIITTSPMVAPLSTFAVLSIMKQSICLHDYCYVLMVLVSSFHSRKMQYQAFFQRGRVLFLSALFLKVLSRHDLSSIQLFLLYCSGSKKLVDMKSYVKSFLSKRKGVTFQHLYTTEGIQFSSQFSVQVECLSPLRNYCLYSCLSQQYDLNSMKEMIRKKNHGCC